HTLRQYQSHVDHHIKPLIGFERLSRLTSPKVVDFRDQLLESRSRALSRKVLTSLKSIINESQTRGLVAQNVAKPVGISTAKRHQEPVKIPTKTDVKALLAALDTRAQNPTPQIARAWRRYRALLMTAVLTGMRASELRGLSKRHIDLVEMVIHVRQRADESGIIGSVKSSAGRRDIPIPEQLCKVLRAWLVECPPGDLSFPNWQGNVEMHANIHNRCWVPISRFAELTDARNKPRYKFHDLRHFHASMLIASGATTKEIMVEMGHSSVQVTFDTYGHLFPEDDINRRRRAEEMAAELSS
ncbi:site-specific integrase, partial [Candidatus Woesearchaeota archaeon]|nr:site-specific integrase [Candidatus Woesearchaeota archaeon]